MIKYSDKMHKISTIISLVLIIIGVIRTLFVYKYLPDNIGVHFDADGSFDVIVNKSKLLYIGYPYVVSLGIVLLFMLGLRDGELCAIKWSEMLDLVS